MVKCFLKMTAKDANGMRNFEDSIEAFFYGEDITVTAPAEFVNTRVAFCMSDRIE